MAVLPLLVIEHEDQSRYGKEVQKVDADGKSHQKAYEHYPAVGVWPVCLLIPLCHGPEYKSCHQR